MALSNWDTFAMDHNGNPCQGEFNSPEGINVRIYKNWIYLKDKSWSKIGERYVRPYSIEIYNSRLMIKDTSVVSLFVGWTIYVAVWSGYEMEGSIEEDTLQGMVGIGTSGFVNDGKYVGVTKKQIIRLKKFLNGPTTVYAINIPKKLRSLNLSKGKRYNQGDAFFHDKSGLDIQCSAVGKAKEPYLIQFIQNMR